MGLGDSRSLSRQQIPNFQTDQSACLLTPWARLRITEGLTHNFARSSLTLNPIFVTGPSEDPFKEPQMWSFMRLSLRGKT